MPTDEAGLLWDGICFIFLLVQLRIFGSHYFHHLVKEIKAQQVLASRGAELIHQIQAKEVDEQKQAENEVMEKIKKKMDRIKANQQNLQKMQGGKAKHMKIKIHQQGNELILVSSWLSLSYVCLYLRIIFVQL